MHVIHQGSRRSAICVRFSEQLFYPHIRIFKVRWVRRDLGAYKLVRFGAPAQRYWFTFRSL